MERFDGYFGYIKKPTTFFVVGSSVSFEKVVILKDNKSGRLDSNQRPPAPHADTLPDCATSRTFKNKAQRALLGLQM